MGVAQAMAPAHLLKDTWPTRALLAQIAVSGHSEPMPLNRRAVVMVVHGFPIHRPVLADGMGWNGAMIAPVVDHRAKRLLAGSPRFHAVETTALIPVLGKGRPGRAISGPSCAMTMVGTAPRRSTRR